MQHLRCHMAPHHAYATQQTHCQQRQLHPISYGIVRPTLRPLNIVASHHCCNSPVSTTWHTFHAALRRPAAAKRPVSAAAAHSSITSAAAHPTASAASQARQYTCSCWQHIVWQEPSPHTQVSDSADEALPCPSPASSEASVSTVLDTGFPMEVEATHASTHTTPGNMQLGAGALQIRQASSDSPFLSDSTWQVAGDWGLSTGTADSISEGSSSATEINQYDVWDEVTYQRQLFERQAAGRQLLQLLARAAEDVQAMQALEHQGLLVLPHSPAAPSAWLEMERDIVQRVRAGSCPAAAMHHHLSNQLVAAPTGLAGSSEDRCQLSRCSHGHVFHDPAINDHLMATFAAVTAAWRRDAQLPQIHLSQYDMFHAHLILGPLPSGMKSTHTYQSSSSLTAMGSSSLTSMDCDGHSTNSTNAILCDEAHELAVTDARPTQDLCLALVFHCQEYPAHCPDTFPYKLGWCQEGSPLTYHGPSFAFRNAVWCRGTLAFLDAGDGSWVNQNLLWPETRDLCTVFEHDLGACIADVNLLLQSRDVLLHQTLQQQHTRPPTSGEAWCWWQGTLLQQQPASAVSTQASSDMSVRGHANQCIPATLDAAQTAEHGIQDSTVQNVQDAGSSEACLDSTYAWQSLLHADVHHGRVTDLRQCASLVLCAGMPHSSDVASNVDH